MTQNIYNRPPITEAVIEICFASPHDQAKLAKTIKKLKALYADFQELKSYDLTIDISNIRQAEPTAKATPQIVHRLSSTDMTQLLLLKESSLLVSQLAPYCGWIDFFDRFTRDWKVWKKYMGFNEIKRIGVRYINRLDIPVSGPTLDFSQYVNIYPKIPGILGPNLKYAMQTQFPINELKSTLILNTAVVPSPLLDHMSLVIDQDIVREVDSPQKDESLYSFLNEVHEKKNTVFESCITDKARELFTHD